MILYHGTDIRLAERIMKEGFIPESNQQHWLGNGIYFFKDQALAKWWTKKPSVNFGTAASEPAIVVCEFHENNKILNLTRLDHYTQFCNLFQNDFWPKYQATHPEESQSWNVRCEYCDYLHHIYDLDAIIGNFYIPEQPYQPKERNNLLEEFRIEYVETQVCVFRQEKITRLRVEKLEEKLALREGFDFNK